MQELTHTSFRRRAGVLMLAALLVCLSLSGTGLAARPDEGVPPAAQEPPAPTPTPTNAARHAPLPPKPTPKATATPTPAQEEAPQGESVAPGDKVNYLLLVNFDHPYRGGGFELVRMDKVIDKGLIGMRNHHQINKTTGVAANLMFRAAKEEGIGKLVVDNVYRSVQRQDTMWEKRLRRNGADYGEDPYKSPVKVLPGGMSEHATGLALDIFAKSYQKSNAAFGETEEGKWLAQHAHRFGFILRYPADKEHITGVIYEPWHFRYVGVTAATEIFERKLCLEEYLKK